MTFAENLRRRRIEHFLSQGELARRSGIHPTTITRLETGFRAPSMRTVRILAAALGVEPHELGSPDEVAERSRYRQRAPAAQSKDEDRLGAWNDDGGAQAVEGTHAKESGIRHGRSRQRP